MAACLNTVRKTVPDLGLPRELRFRQHAHVDQVSSPLTIHVTLSPRGKLWSFHAHDALVRDELHSAALGSQRMSDGALKPFYEPTAEWITESGVSDDGRAFKETRGAYALGAVDDLRRQCEHAWLDILAEGAYGAECEEGAHAKGFERRYVRAGGDGRGAECMSLSVTSDESD